MGWIDKYRLISLVNTNLDCHAETMHLNTVVFIICVTYLLKPISVYDIAYFVIVYLKLSFYKTVSSASCTDDIFGCNLVMFTGKHWQRW